MLLRLWLGSYWLHKLNWKRVDVFTTLSLLIQKQNVSTMFFLKIYIFYWLCYYSCPIFSPLYSPSPYNPSPTSIPCLIHFHDLYNKFLGFSISYTVLNFPLPILYLLFILCIPCTVSPLSSLPIPTDNSPCDVHFCDSVPVLVVCLVCFYFCW